MIRHMQAGTAPVFCIVRLEVVISISTLHHLRLFECTVYGSSKGLDHCRTIRLPGGQAAAGALTACFHIIIYGVGFAANVSPLAELIKCTCKVQFTIR